MTPGFCLKQYRRLLAEVISKKILTIVTLSMATPGIALAAEWEFTPVLNVTETYTDNVTLAIDQDSESDWISQINPGLILTGKGKKLELTLGYQMQNILYAGDSERNNTYHQLNADVHMTLAPRWLFLDASSTLSQQVLSPDENVSIGNLNIVGGREDVQASSISPYVSTRLSSWVLADLRYTHDRVEYSGDTAIDSFSDQVSYQLQSAKAFGSWTWLLRYTEQDIEYSNQSITQIRADEKRRDAVFDLGFQVSARIRLTGQVGYEDNEYQVSADSEVPEGDYWSLGAIWMPSAQTTLSASGGYRYYGRTWALNLQHQAKRNSWQLSYIEGITSQRELQLDQRNLLVFNQDGTPVLDPVTQEQQVFSANILVPTNEVFLNKGAEFLWVMNSRKSTITLRSSHNRRELQESGDIETTTGLGLGWNWRVSRQGEFGANVGVQNTERDTGDDRYTIFGLNYEEQLGRSVSSTFGLRHVNRDTDGLSNDYRENQLNAGLQMSW